MSENEKLRQLLAEARVWMLADSRSTRDYASKVFDLNQRIIAALDQPKSDPTLTVREACRRRMPIDGADAQALEHALTITERERDEARAEAGRLTQRIAALENALASISLDEYESTSSASEKVHGHARTARKALYGEEKP
jgi:hypothetical protein